MLHVQQTDDTTLEISIQGKLTEESIVSTIGDIDRFLSNGENLKLVMRVDDMGFANFRAFMADLTEGIKTLPKIGHLDRIALATNQTWLKVGSKIDSALIPDLIVKTFDLEEMDAARSWVDADPTPTATEPVNPSGAT